MELCKNVWFGSCSIELGLFFFNSIPQPTENGKDQGCCRKQQEQSAATQTGMYAVQFVGMYGAACCTQNTC